MPTDYAELGSVNLTRLNGSIPFYMFTYNGRYMKKYDEAKCKGDCL